MYEAIKEQIRNDNLILFIGAGVPATLGIPTWGELIDKISDELEYDSNIFKLYGDYLSLAEYYKIKKGSIGELRYWMTNNWDVSDEALKASKIYHYITTLNCRLIYTTNYEHSIERAFNLNDKPYKRIVDVSDLVGLSPELVQIVKFHGDLVNDNSIVLTEEDYFERLEFESPMDIKLRADMLGKSILFIGYSMSDINMRLLIYKLDKLWKSTNQNGQRPKSFIFLSNHNPVQEEVFKHRGIEPVVGTEIDPQKSLEQFLYELTR